MHLTRWASLVFVVCTAWGESCDFEEPLARLHGGGGAVLLRRHLLGRRHAVLGLRPWPSATAAPGGRGESARGAAVGTEELQERDVMMGSSAGALAAQVYSPTILELIPHQNAAVISDSYAGVFPSNTEGAVLQRWKACSLNIFSPEQQRACQESRIGLPDVVAKIIQEHPTVAYGFIQSKADSFQRLFYELVAFTIQRSFSKLSGPLFYKLSNRIFKEYNKHKNFLLFLVDGDNHEFNSQRIWNKAGIKGAVDGSPRGVLSLQGWVRKVLARSCTRSLGRGRLTKRLDSTKLNYRYNRVFPKELCFGTAVMRSLGYPQAQYIEEGPNQWDQARGASGHGDGTRVPDETGGLLARPQEIALTSEACGDTMSSRSFQPKLDVPGRLLSLNLVLQPFLPYSASWAHGPGSTKMELFRRRKVGEHFARITVPLYEVQSPMASWPWLRWPTRRSQVHAALERRPGLGWMVLSLLEEPAGAAAPTLRTDDIVAAERGSSVRDARSTVPWPEACPLRRA
ncbi:unnamed protein product [Durusdinium trenchii]|uniref:PNPLA domain-containing protein n=1 Tax=Durusdinium trenchii TaxID=1381693 RepID=A0ABP0S3Z7_9DINO